jgi:hypothetical protein
LLPFDVDELLVEVEEERLAPLLVDEDLSLPGTAFTSVCAVVPTSPDSATNFRLPE